MPDRRYKPCIEKSNIRQICIVLSVSVYDHLYYPDREVPFLSLVGICDPPQTECDAGFSYNRGNPCYGPESWSNISTCFHHCNNGFQQSPINLRSAQSFYIGNLPPILLRPAYEWSNTNTANFQNRAPEFRSFPLSTPALDLDHPLMHSGVFGFENIHIHIGQYLSRGSEHSINDIHSPLEAHLVFSNKAVSTTLREARVHQEGLMVVGVMLEIPRNAIEDVIAFGLPPTPWECQQILSRSGHNLYWYNSRMQPYSMYAKYRTGGRSNSFFSQFLLREGRRVDGLCPTTRAVHLSRVLECAYRSDVVSRFKEPGTASRLPVTLLPEDALPVSRHYYTYKGSLTTPPCTENVQWIVMRCPVQVSARVLFSLRRVEGYRDLRTLSRYGIRRPLQYNVNPVYKSFFGL